MDGIDPPPPRKTAHDMTPPPLTLEDLESALTFDEAMKRLGVSRTTLKRMIGDREIGVIRVGAGRGHPRIPERSIVDYVNRRYQRAEPPTEADHR